MNTYINTRQHNGNRFMFFIIVLLILGVIGVSIWFISQRILQNPHAAASTTLAFDNAVQTVHVGQDLSGDITVDPGTNKVSLIKLVLDYDGSKFATSSGIVVNTTAFPTTLDGPNYTCDNTNCQISMTVSVGPDPTKAIQTKTTVATLHMTAIDTTTQGPVQVIFDSATTVLSIAAGDQANENVLSSSTPLTVTITGPGSNPTPTPGGSCQMNVSNCQWDPRPTASSYHYKITDVTSGYTIKEGNVDAPQTQVDFPSQAGHTYSCTITAVNTCKSSNPQSTTVTCPLPSATPTPSVCSGPGIVKNLHISCPDCVGGQ